jgi:hypothetical protein
MGKVNQNCVVEQIRGSINSFLALQTEQIDFYRYHIIKPLRTFPSNGSGWEVLN